MTTLDAPPKDETPVRNTEDAQSHMLQLNLLNGFSCSSNGQTLPLKSLKAKAVIACAALLESGVISRETLKARLWSQSNEKRAQDSLRRAILDIRKAFTEIGFQYFGADRECFFIEPGHIETDVSSFIESLATLTPDPSPFSNAHPFDNLLVGFDRIDAVFAEWVRVERSALRKQAEAALQQQIDSDRHSDAALNQVARLLLEFNPSSEQACGCLIRSHIKAGDTAAAHKQLQSFADYLHRNFSRLPSTALQSLLVDTVEPDQPTQLQQSAKTISQPMAPCFEDCTEKQVDDDDRAPVVVVMPLIRNGKRRNRFPVGTGFRFELVAALVRFREWGVVDVSAESHIEGLRTHNGPVYKLELGTIEGERNFRLTVNFSHLHTGKLIWSEHWRDQHDDWVAMQHHVVGKLAVAMDLSLSHVRMQELLSHKTYSLTAYDNWLLAQENLLEFSSDGWSRATQLLQNLTIQWPSFARTYSSLSQMQNLRHLSLPGYYSEEKTQKLARVYALEAVRLDPLDSRAQLCLGWSYAMNHDFDNAIVTFKRACELNEFDSWSTISSAVGLAFSDEIAGATRLSQQAAKIQLLPTPVYWSYQAAVKFLIEDFEGCVTNSIAANEITVDVPAWHAAALFHIGDFVEAKRVYTRFIEIVRARWAVRTEPDTDAISNWLSQCFPLKNSNSRRNLLHALRQLDAQHVNSDPFTDSSSCERNLNTER